jgi:hypothetical protein
MQPKPESRSPLVVLVLSPNVIVSTCIEDAPDETTKASGLNCMGLCSIKVILYFQTNRTPKVIKTDTFKGGLSLRTEILAFHACATNPGEDSQHLYGDDSLSIQLELLR